MPSVWGCILLYARHRLRACGQRFLGRRGRLCRLTEAAEGEQACWNVDERDDRQEQRYVHLAADDCGDAAPQEQENAGDGAVDSEDAATEAVLGNGLEEGYRTDFKGDDRDACQGDQGDVES